MEKKHKSPAKKLPLPHRAVLAVISPDRRTTVSEVSKLTGIHPQRVREIVADLVRVYHKPVGSSVAKGNSGFFIITDERDRDEAIHHLESRIQYLTERITALKAMDINKKRHSRR